MKYMAWPPKNCNKRFYCFRPLPGLEVFGTFFPGVCTPYRSI